MLAYIFSWATLYYLMLMLYVPSCIGLIVIVLLQKGKGVGFAGAFGAGPGSDAVFGPRNIRSLPQKLTYTMATIFMMLAIIISIIYGRVSGGVAPELVDEVAATGSYDALFEDTEPGSGAQNGAAGDVSDLTIDVQSDGAVTPAGTITSNVSVETAEPAGANAPVSVSVEEAASDVTEAVEAANDTATETVDGAADEVTETADDTAAAATDAAEDAAEDVTEAADDTAEAVEEAVTAEDSAQ